MIETTLVVIVLFPLAPRKILKRLLDEFNDFLKKKTSVEKESVESEEIRDLIRELTDTLKKITEAGYRSVIIIDPLNKVDESGQTTKVIHQMLLFSLVALYRQSAN